MISFLLCLAILVGGYFVYGKIVDNTFGPDDRETPAVRINDGVDYVVMPQWKLFLVQLLNIAGLGPIFGAMQGALWGPVVFLWITFGTIFAGGVHDYFSGMMSERNDGASIAEITGKYLGPVMQNVMRVFSVVLLIMVGTVFAVGPAGLIVELCSQSGASGVMTSLLFWLVIILTYYFIATFISIDAVIGKIYPVFGICLIIMAIGVIFGIFTNPAYTIPEIWDHFGSMHPSGTPIWSFMFITVACGAISGFHSTQSPLMARCMKSEKQGHFVFYGAMVCEGVIALIWAAAGCSLYEVTDGLNTGLAQALAMGQSKAIYDVCSKTMGGVGIALAMIGVVVCPITSGDTAFRSARLTLADWFKIDLDKLEPTVSMPHLPENTKVVSEVAGLHIDQVVIGSCTNGRIQDLREAAAILKGKKVAENVRCIVIPATQEITLQAMKEGLLEIFIASGCAVSAPTCGPCLGGHMGVMAEGERCVSTTNRNFVGRMGHVQSEVILASPAVAAASAVAGCVADPRI